MYPESILTADVGGTHTRFAMVTISDTASWKLTHRLEIGGQLPDFPSMLRAYLARCDLGSIPGRAVIAAAGPVVSGKVELTNRSLQISEPELLQFGFARARLINDFAALAFAADVLGPQDLRTIGPSVNGIAGAPVTIVGAGTGFGVSYLVRAGDRAVAVATEGGHLGFAPTNNQEMEILAVLEQWYGHVSVERILSGSGIEALHRILADFAGREYQPTSAEAISGGALSGDTVCCATLSLFGSIYGAVAGDMALAHGARGGVLIAGGIAPSIERFLRESPFRHAFEAKGRLSSYVQSIPTRLIVNPDATLIGAARAGIEAWGGS
jgi:glucokinase